MNNLSKPDFTNQHIYVGMDVHKKNWSISIVTEHSAHKDLLVQRTKPTKGFYRRKDLPFNIKGRIVD